MAKTKNKKKGKRLRQRSVEAFIGDVLSCTRLRYGKHHCPWLKLDIGTGEETVTVMVFWKLAQDLWDWLQAVYGNQAPQQVVGQLFALVGDCERSRSGKAVLVCQGIQHLMSSDGSPGEYMCSKTGEDMQLVLDRHHRSSKLAHRTFQWAFPDAWLAEEGIIDMQEYLSDKAKSEARNKRFFDEMERWQAAGGTGAFPPDEETRRRIDEGGDQPKPAAPSLGTLVN